MARSCFFDTRYDILSHFNYILVVVITPSRLRRTPPARAQGESCPLFKGDETRRVGGGYWGKSIYYIRI